MQPEAVDPAAVLARLKRLAREVRRVAGQAYSARAYGAMELRQDQAFRSTMREILRVVRPDPIELKVMINEARDE